MFLIAILASLSAACASDVDKCVRAEMAVWDQNPASITLQGQFAFMTRLEAEAAFRLRCLAASGGVR